MPGAGKARLEEDADVPTFPEFRGGELRPHRPLLDGDVPIDGVAPVFLRLSPEEIFFRAFRHAEFDIRELSLSSYTVKTANNESAYVGVPAFLSRAFRHTSVYIRNDAGIEKPEDLKDLRVGNPEYQLTANVRARAILEDDFGVKPSDVTWVRGRRPALSGSTRQARTFSARPSAASSSRVSGARGALENFWPSRGKGMYASPSIDARR